MQKTKAGEKPRIVLIGAVGSTKVSLHKLAEHQANLVGVFGYESESTEHVSGYTDLAAIAAEGGYHYFSFKKINSEADKIRSLKPDYIFVIGLSQMVSTEILAIPSVCCIGFHPTSLPQGRGRAPLTWLILDQQSEGSATFFVLSDGVDSGAIVVQRKFPVSDNDDVSNLIDKTYQAMGSALDELLPALTTDVPKAREQNEAHATYYEKRVPEDGLINWSWSADEIARLIRATTSPYPGAFSFVDDQRITVFTARKYMECRVQGVPGRILRIGANGSFVVQCGTGLLEVLQYVTKWPWSPLVGADLGYKGEFEIYLLKKRVDQLEQLLASR